MAFSGIKKSFAQKKQRTAEEINQEYSGEAILAGHKLRLIVENALEIWTHAKKMIAINREALALPKAASTPEAQSQEMTAEQEHA